MTVLDIIRLATERAEQTGDLSNPLFHDALATVAESLAGVAYLEKNEITKALHDVARNSCDSANALRSFQSKQALMRPILYPEAGK